MFPAQTRFLVVDDSENIRELLKRELRTLGFTEPVLEGSTADEAFELLKGRLGSPKSIECVISDWNMPGTSGLDFLKAVRALPETRALPFLLVTSEANAEQVLEAAAVGVSNYVVKPFNAETLREKLLSVYKKHFPGK